MERFLLALTATGIALFALIKPVHIDDTVVLHVAANILRDPLRPFAGEFFWLEEPQPLAKVTTNPPLVSYWLAPWIALAGYREWVLHLSFAPFVALLMWGMHRLATRWLGAQWAWWAVGWLMLSPAVLPGMNLMRDVPALALLVGGLACWVEGAGASAGAVADCWRAVGRAGGAGEIHRADWAAAGRAVYAAAAGVWRVGLADACAAADCGLVGAEPVDGRRSASGVSVAGASGQRAAGSEVAAWRRRAGRKHAAVAGGRMAVPRRAGARLAMEGRAAGVGGCAGAIGWRLTQFAGQPVYGQTLFWLIAGVLVLGLAIGVGLFEDLPPSLRFPPLREGNQAGAGSPTLREGNQVGGGTVPPARRGNLKEGVPEKQSPLAEGNQVGGGTVPPARRGNLKEGVLSETLVTKGVPENRSKSLYLFLRLWLLIALVAAVWGVPFQAMRHLLYALPPLILVLTPWVGRNAPLLIVQGVLCLAVIAADYDYAIRYKRGAAAYAELFAGERVWYAGSWGWMFYAEQHGFRKLLPDGKGLQRGDIVIIPERVYKGKTPPDLHKHLILLDETPCYPIVPLRTMDFRGAAYYALIRTNAPFRFTLRRDEPLEIRRAYRWMPPR
jgi:hypothetical protein